MKILEYSGKSNNSKQNLNDDTAIHILGESNKGPSSTIQLEQMKSVRKVS